MNTIILKDFELENYHTYNDFHNEIINRLSCDDGVKKYLGNLEYLITKIQQRYQENFVDTLYLVYKENKPIGIVTVCLRDEKYEIDCGILPEYRQKYYATILLNEFTEYLFNKYQRLDKVYLQIDGANDKSKIVAARNGYINEQGDLYYKSR